jgi:F-type H+-transporting ATPase subunit b
MDEILHELGDLFLGSVPTVILFLLVLILYKTLVYTPLLKTLAERRARTLGTVEHASAAIQSADAKSQEYEARLRAARLDIGRQREQRVQQWNRERENLLADARHASDETVKHAQASMEREVASSRTGIEANADSLADQVLSAILPASAGRKIEGSAG